MADVFGVGVDDVGTVDQADPNGGLRVGQGHGRQVGGGGTGHHDAEEAPSGHAGRWCGQGEQASPGACVGHGRDDRRRRTALPGTSRVKKAITELYLVTFDDATDITELQSLKGLSAGSDFTPVTKTFLADNESLGGLREIPWKAATFGPMIDDTRASLIMVSDNGLDQYLPTYFAYIAMEGIQPRRPWVKEDSTTYGQYEERDMTTEQGTPARIRIIREQKANAPKNTLGAG